MALSLITHTHTDTHLHVLMVDLGNSRQRGHVPAMPKVTLCPMDYSPVVANDASPRGD